MPLIPISYSSVSYCRRCLRCAKRCSFCWVRCFLLTSSPSLFTLNLKSAFSRGFSFRKLQIFISRTTDFHFVSQTAVSRFNFRCEVFDIRDHGPWTGATPRCLLLNESCWPKILYRKNYGDKKGSKSFQQQIKMFWREFGWPSMKVLQIKVRRLNLFRCSLKLQANVECTLTRKRSV